MPHPVRTLSMEDQVLTAANNGRVGAILSALDYVSDSILFVVLAIPLRVTLSACVAGVVLAPLAAWLPALRMRRLEVHEALGGVA